ncbi:PAS domain S-box protein [Mucilaginibacter sp. ZT4R22]|uniref:histidine kinase n=1 Tax=Mucilaginibacter pankratovii TaxID=2772110 RepID=A0ABR7WMP3_9SPHI|nr:PAS domain S-box protein [Mucilaginibacter pankratovii]MBD1362644.1 PAS domain S-box protein [Mucilaginibacter pankratovii]
MKRILLGYEAFIRANISSYSDNNDRDLRYWQDRLFSNFLVYCLPISLIALLPGVFMALKDGFLLIAVVDLVCFGLIMLVTVAPKVKLRYRKISVITIFYVLAIFLINTLGYLGPGVFYLFFITMLSALIFPIRYSYFSIFLNAALLAVFAFIIGFKLFHSALINEYSAGKWIAFSVNLIFASTVIVLLIDKIFQSLQSTIVDKTHLQQRYLQIFNKSPLPMWLFDTDTFKFLDINEAATEHYGYTREEFLSMTIMDIRQKENIRQTEELVRTNKLSGEYYGGVSRHLKKNGEIIYVNVESNLLSLDGRQVRLVQSTDITTQLEHQLELYEANLKVKESESNLRTLFDNAIDGFVLLDQQHKVKLFNPKASESMKFNKHQSPFKIGCSIFDYVETSRLAYFHEIITKVYNGDTVDYDRMFRTNGAVQWIRYTLNPVWEEQRIVGACITGRDVTERKLYLRSVEEQNKTFREISWMQSHLVRAPLARIMGLLPMLPNAADDLERTELINFLNLSAHELDDIIREITDKSTVIMAKYGEPKGLD